MVQYALYCKVAGTLTKNKKYISGTIVSFAFFQKNCSAVSLKNINNVQCTQTQSFPGGFYLLYSRILNCNLQFP